MGQGNSKTGSQTIATQDVGTISKLVEKHELEKQCAKIKTWLQLQHPTFLCPKYFRVQKQQGLCCHLNSLQVAYQLPYSSLKSRAGLNQSEACLILNSGLVALSFLEQIHEHHGCIRPDFIFLQKYGGAKIISPALCLSNDNYNAVLSRELDKQLLHSRLLEVGPAGSTLQQLSLYDLYALAVCVVQSCTPSVKLPLMSRLKMMEEQFPRASKLLQQILSGQQTAREVLDRSRQSNLLQSELSLASQDDFIMSFQQRSSLQAGRSTASRSRLNDSTKIKVKREQRHSINFLDSDCKAYK